MPTESLIKQKIRINGIVSRLKLTYPDSRCSLHYKSSFQLLVATILSAQCTDERVNNVTIKLFDKYKEPKDFVQLPLEEIKREIYSTGFYNNKAKSIKELSIMLLDKFNGIVPDKIEEMIKLPGVGRKTANVVLGNIFNIPSLVVDTHVTRICNLLKFVKTKNATIIEKKMNKIVNESDWTIFAHLLIDHGRAICIANRPNCNNCVIADLCPSNKLGR